VGVLKKEEAEFLRSHEVCRFATASKDGWPHVTPVIYAMDGENIVIAIDYGEKKLKNLKENNRVSVVIDEYRPNMAVVVQGLCKILEKGSEYGRLQKLLFDKFETYRKNPWKEGESPILKVVPVRGVSWGISKG
jgi:nitroimidazol reductase NimA-like FMN-containing flavoprotein (pyridoxamine 5'-phosphate oxidase superfamily)